MTPDQRPVPGQCPVLDWAASGGMALTGFPAESPLTSPADSFALLQRVAGELATVTRDTGTEVRADPAELIAGRAALAGFARQGQVSAGGSTRLLRARDGWCAVTLSRIADIECVPAVLGVLGAHSLTPTMGRGSGLDAMRAAAWSAMTAVAATHSSADLADAAQLLGIPASVLPQARPDIPWPPWHTTRIADTSPTARLDGAVVADLSAMWAGPLCARLLGLAGAHVIKVESPDRPDGARAGNQRFYDWLHDGHKSIAFPYETVRSHSPLLGILSVADVVIEASRPRALASLGVAPGMIGHKPGQVWLSITGYGREAGNSVAFGDDAAVAGGLVAWPGGAWGADDPVFCADAIADPLTGITGALAVVKSISEGGGDLIDLPMRSVAAAFAAASTAPHGTHELRDDGRVHCPALSRSQHVLPPRPPAPTGRAADLGTDTEAVLGWLAAR